MENLTTVESKSFVRSTKSLVRARCSLILDAQEKAEKV